MSKSFKHLQSYEGYVNRINEPQLDENLFSKKNIKAAFKPLGWTTDVLRDYLNMNDPDIKDEAKQAKFKEKVEKFFKDNPKAAKKLKTWKDLTDEEQKEKFLKYLSKSDNFLTATYYAWDDKKKDWVENATYSADGFVPSGRMSAR